jgi:hypothetical protein
MRFRICALTCLLLGWPGLAVAQSIKTPAEIMPADAVAYVELRQPGQIVKEIQGLLEGSVLSKPTALAKLQEKYKTSAFRRGPEEAMAASLLLAPEIPAELGRMQGAAIALTGVDKTERGSPPEFVAVILPGDSNILRLAWRAFPLTFSSGYGSFGGKVRVEGMSRFEAIGEVEGVTLYRMKMRERRTTEGKETVETVREEGPALASLADVLVVGSVERVKEVIGRAKGNVRTPALAGSRAYQDAIKGMGDRPGVLSLGDVKSLLAMLDQAPLSPHDREVFATIKKLVNPSALVNTNQSLSLANGALKFRWQAQLDPNEKSRVLDVVPSAGINPQMLQFVPRDATLLVAVSNADGEQRFGNLLTFANDIHRASGGRGRAPSDDLDRLEKMLGAKIGKDILGKIHGMAVSLKAPGNISELTPPPALVVIQGTDEAAAKTLAEETIPHFYGLATNTPGLKAETQEVQGQTVSVLPFISYGRQGATLVIGSKPELVADALNNGAKKQGLLADPKIGARLAKAEGTVLFLAAKPLTMASKSLPLGLPFMPAEERALAVKLVVPLQQLAKNEEPIVLHVTRTREAITAEFVVAGLKEVAPKAADFGVEMFLQMEKSRYERFAQPAPKAIKK